MKYLKRKIRISTLTRNLFWVFSIFSFLIIGSLVQRVLTRNSCLEIEKEIIAFFWKRPSKCFDPFIFSFSDTLTSGIYTVAIYKIKTLKNIWTTFLRSFLHCHGNIVNSQKCNCSGSQAWNRDALVEPTLYFSKTMSRNSFQIIWQFLHFRDGDSYWGWQAVQSQASLSLAKFRETRLNGKVAEHKLVSVSLRI